MNHQEAAFKKLEAQVGQLATTVVSRSQGTLPSNSEINPKEQVHIINQDAKKARVEEEINTIKVSEPRRGKYQNSNSCRKAESYTSEFESMNRMNASDPMVCEFFNNTKHAKVKIEFNINKSHKDPNKEREGSWEETNQIRAIEHPNQVNLIHLELGEDEAIRIKDEKPLFLVQLKVLTKVDTY
ncbi:hypothetical protein H6P81_009610 [Aristolochia fimbriata]|uniref:Uncharacterized protein n=1 Tax=Aristolochia fimbriata TaxID=158543 RepID=A0AAV7ELF1_ARIFI|nr:hypothetical protein H6P81_009610 [Aristolochia fimbriata]